MLLRTVIAASALVIASATSTAAIVNITNGVGGDGHLDIDVDDYGSFGNWDGPGQDDQFDPPGVAGGVMGPSFSFGWMVFTAPAGGGDTANLLSAIASWEAFIGTLGQGTRTLDRVIDSPNALAGPNECNSTFHLQEAGGGPIRLNFSLNQFVGPASAGVTYYRQIMTVTNAGSEAVALVLYRPWDLDLLWDTSFTNDFVGAGGGRSYVFEHEPGVTAHGFALSSLGPPFSFYYGSKNGYVPPNGPPNMGFGSDVQGWDARGIPMSWRNLIAYLGYDMDGNSGVNDGDAHIALEWRTNLAPGQSIKVIMLCTYGQISPALTAATVLPTSVTFFRGVLVSGNLQSLHAADDNRLVGRPGVVLNQAERPIQIIIEGTAPGTTSSLLRLVVEAHCNIPNINQRVEEFNFTSNSYTQLDSRNMPSADIRIEMNVPNASAHISGARLLRARISYKEAGPVFSYPWFARIDEATWRLVP